MVSLQYEPRATRLLELEPPHKQLNDMDIYGLKVVANTTNNCVLNSVARVKRIFLVLTSFLYLVRVKITATCKSTGSSRIL